MGSVNTRERTTMLSSLPLWISSITGIFSLKDVVEVLFFSVVVYRVLLWLKKDTDRNLLMGCYIYCSLLFISYYADLPIIQLALFVSMPFVAMLFIILHQETLQRNYVKLSKGTVPLQETIHWVDELIKCCLTALNRHKEIILVIERNDLLKTLIHAPYYIYAELKRDVFDILIEKHMASNDYMIWVNQQGKLVAINATWRTRLDEAWISKEAAHMHSWKQHALFITAKTDALMFKVNPLTRSFDLVIQGKIVEGIHAEQLSTFMKKNLIVNKKAVKQSASKEAGTAQQVEQSR